MADPVTIGLMVGATVLKTMSTINASKFNEEVANQNKTIAAQQTASNVAQQKRENIRRMGAVRAARGSSGTTIDGSA